MAKDSKTLADAKQTPDRPPAAPSEASEAREPPPEPSPAAPGSASGASDHSGRASDVVRHASTVSAYTIGSRVAGLARDAIFMHLFGATHGTDAFLMAFTIPNTFRMLVAEGALTVAFLPVFNEAQRRDGAGAARALMGEAIAVFPSLGAILTVLCIVFAEPIVTVFAPGFAAVPGKFELTVTLTRWMFPFLAMISFVALAMGALNARKHFASSAASPLLFNLVHIAGMVTLAQVVDPPMLGVAFGVLLGGMAQVLLQWVALGRAGLAVRPRFHLGPQTRRILGLMVPALGSLAVYQINIMILRLFTSYLEEGAVTYLYNADRFFQLPLGVFSIAIATASLPALSDAHADGQSDRLTRTFGRSLALTNFISAPATIALMVLALPIVATILQHGSFTARMAQKTAEALVVLAVGLVAVSAIRVAAQAFFAMKDTRTPVLCGAVGLATNVVCAPILAARYGVPGLAGSITVSAWVHMVVELVLLRRRLGPMGLGRLIFDLLRDSAVAGVMGAVVAGVALLGSWRDGTSLQNVGVLALAVVVGAGTYGALQWLTRSPSMMQIVDGLQRRRRRR